MSNEELEKRIKVLEDRLNNYSFLIKLSQVLNIDKTLVKEVETYKQKARLYDRLLSDTQSERLINRKDYEFLCTEASFLDALMKLVELWASQQTNTNLAADMNQMLKSYIEMQNIKRR